ncbi:voltage-gated hydrogen channel 1-like [Conger conger]|uniref:voltage-gated hydrogen channel 1-like n=1 Tax=Conger conger TaxID=82655 RepID=UPI002A5A2D9B|nr:voltage-gated hydrogen channel 1-like [Conger conger]XP_061118998.1 voltage-gated hydrogen channel 1-like [Conger conger]XP_061118999.1 voltage-gated hydrogen channel 1-like [Conger conger]XP_061119001.1 voltage-gated hydrogen channel 1-like [Conger conger]
MSMYLRHFTAVGDDYENITNWQEEEEPEASDTPGQTGEQSVEPATFRDSLRKLFSCNKFQIAVVVLVILDAAFVLCELIIDLSIIKADKGMIAPQVFHYLSLVILTFFMVELAGKLYAYRLEFFRHKFEVFDAVVVVVSFVLDLVYVSSEGSFDGMGLLILLRLWRVARIVNGILIPVKNRADHKVQKLKESNSELTQQVSSLKELNSKMEQENSRLSALLRQHAIDF